MNKSVILYQGEKFVSNGTLFAKDVVKVGRWVHPVTKREIVFTPERIVNLARNTERYLQAGNKIPFPKGHTTDPTKNLGYWQGPILPFRDTLMAIVEPKDPAAIEGMKNGTLDGVSVCIEMGITDPKQNTYDEVITHICATSYPVIDGQKGFIQLSQGHEESDSYIPTELAGTLPEGDMSLSRKEGSMDPKKMAVALGLPEETPEGEIVKAAVNARKASDDLKTAQEATKNAQTSLSKLTEQFSTHGFKLEGEKLVRLAPVQLDLAAKDGDSDEIKAYKEELRKNREKEQMGAASSTKEFVTNLSKKMQLPPALLSLAEEVLSARGEMEAILLSSDGKGLNVKKLENFPGKVKELLEKITTCKPIAGKGLQQLSTDKPTSDDGSSKTREELATEVVKRLQPETAAAK